MTPQLFPRWSHWPLHSSALGGAHAQLIIAALNDPALIVFAGWNVDSFQSGPVWHRWAKQLEKDALGPRIGVAFLSALYGLACHGMLQLPGTGGNAPLMRLGAERDGSALLAGSLEAELLAYARDRDGCSIQDAIEHLLPKKGWLRRDHPEDWFHKHGIALHGRDAKPERLVASLGLAALFVELETGRGIEEPQGEELAKLLEKTEKATFQHLE